MVPVSPVSFRAQSHTLVKLGYIDGSWPNKTSAIAVVFVKASDALQLYSHAALEMCVSVCTHTLMYVYYLQKGFKVTARKAVSSYKDSVLSVRTNRKSSVLDIP